MKRLWNPLALVPLAAGALFAAAAGGGWTAWFLFDLFALLGLYAAVVPALALRGAAVRRHVALPSGPLAAGSETTVSLTVELRSRLPVPWLLVCDNWSEQTRRQEGTAHVLLFPWFARRVSCAYRIRGLQRGVYRFRDVEMATGDAFGLLERRRKLVCPGSFVVVPQPLALRTTLPEQALAAANPRPGGELTGGKTAFDSAQTAATVRPYSSGDPQRAIDWKATARRGELHTREREKASAGGLLVLLDGSRSAYADAGALFERAVRAAATLLRDAAARGERCAFACGPLAANAAGASGARQLQERLAAASADAGEPYADAVARQLAVAAYPGSAVACITPQPDERLLRQLAQLAAGGQRVLLLAVRPFCAEPGLAAQGAGVGAGKIAARQAAGAAAEAQREAAWRERLQRRLAALGCAFAVVENPREEMEAKPDVEPVYAT
ncbi:DUF58 domain-containing protein [Paenibacillus cymbidii]|uniref:DUF58 domain-containing protein n=1 Tax=Paenibacillus cymbidii TaxID=1639034 RepID=UPI001081D7E9|nr:DUF58 domain-containing protein [Paenibacillus cymbidii]